MAKAKSSSKADTGSATSARTGQMTSGSNTKAGAAAPDAQRTTAAKKTAAEELFHDADKDGNPTPEASAARRAATGL